MQFVTRQTTWGWAVAGYLFLAGVGGGTFLFSFIFNTLGMYAPIVKIGCLIGPLLVLLGTFFLLFDLGNVKGSFWLISAPSRIGNSWMARGVWILGAFIILGLIYSLPAFGWLSWQKSGLGLGIGIVAVILSILVVAYPGFLLGNVRGIPFWNTPALPLLFLLSGLDTGIAVLNLTAIFPKGGIVVSDFHLLGIGDISIIILLLIILGAYIEIVRQSGVTGAISVSFLRTPLFFVGVISFGLVIPLVLLIYSIFVTDITTIRLLAGLVSVFLLLGGLCLRYSVIRAGVPVVFYLPA